MGAPVQQLQLSRNRLNPTSLDMMPVCCILRPRSEITEGNYRGSLVASGIDAVGAPPKTVIVLGGTDERAAEPLTLGVEEASHWHVVSNRGWLQCRQT